MKWSLWIDDHRVDLPASGTSDRVLSALPQAGGKDVILREWRVTLVEPTVGEHTVRYRSEPTNTKNSGVTDATWTFTMQNQGSSSRRWGMQGDSSRRRTSAANRSG